MQVSHSEVPHGISQHPVWNPKPQRLSRLKAILSFISVAFGKFRLSFQIESRYRSHFSHTGGMAILQTNDFRLFFKTNEENWSSAQRLAVTKKQALMRLRSESIFIYTCKRLSDRRWTHRTVVNHQRQAQALQNQQGINLSVAQGKNEPNEWYGGFKRTGTWPLNYCSYYWNKSNRTYVIYLAVCS